MKKSFKILTLVLSLALLCGALVVAVLADEPAELTGVDVCFSTDFTGVASLGSQTGNKNMIKVDGKEAFNVDNKGAGSANIVVDAQGNSYFSFDYEGSEDKAGTAGNYTFTAPKLGTAWTTPSSMDTFKGYYYTDNKYYVVDFDVYFPEGVPNGSSAFYFYNYIPTYGPVTTDGVTTDKWGNATEGDKTKAFHWVFKNGDNGAVVVETKNGKTYNLLDGAWTHFTAFVTYEIAEDGTFYIISYTAINGQIVDIYKHAMPVKANTPDPNAWWPKTARFEFNSKDTAGREMDIDNFTIRKLTKEYNGNLDEVVAEGIGAKTSTWESDLYKNGENTPFTTAAASVNGKEYDHLQRAIDAAKDGDTITLLANVKSSVNVGKPVTIACGEYTLAKPTLAPGYIAGYAEGTTNYVIEATQDSAAILFEDCTCPDCKKAGTSDPTHPGGVMIEAAYRDNDIFNFYVNAGKSLDWSLDKGIVSYKLTGWVDEDGNTYKSGDVITEAIVGDGGIVLYPVIEVEEATIEYIKGGAVAYASGAKALSNAIANADKGTTIKLIGNTKYAGTAIELKNKLTLDLNGYALQAVPTSNNVSSKPGLFSVKTSEVTIIGEQKGSALISFWVDKVNVKSDGSVDTAIYYSNNPTFTMSGDSGTLTFKGENLYVNASQLVRVNSSGKTIKIDGGTYARDAASDGMSYIYGAGSVKNTTVEVKNAIVNTSNFITWYDTAPNTATVDNCVLICGLGNLFNPKYGYADVTITNSYIACNPSSKNATITIGEGNYIRDNSTWDSSVVYTAGVIAEATSNKVTHKFYKTVPKVTKEDGKFVVDESTYEILEGTRDVTYTKYTKSAVIVNFMDGETLLATVNGDSGKKVVGPANGEAAFSVANGWVIATPAYAYTISQETTAPAVVNVDIKDLAETGYIYTAGTPELYLNYRLSDNLATNLYRPKVLPEGITLVDTVLDGVNRNRKWEGNWTINGVECYSTQGWPIAWGVDENKPVWELIYTYDGTTLSYTVNGNVVDYAKKVVAKYESDAVKMKQIVALLQYVETANKLKGYTISNGLSEYLQSLKDSGITLDAIPEETYDLSAISTYISGASVGINSGRGGAIKFTLTDAGKAEGITYKIIASVNKNAEIPFTISGGVIMTDNAHIPTMGAHKFTVVVYNAGEEVARTDYSIAAYYTATKPEGNEYAMIEALYNLSKIGNQTN